VVSAVSFSKEIVQIDLVERLEEISLYIVIMSYSELQPQGLSNLVEAATALATFSSCSTSPTHVEDLSYRNAKSTSSIEVVSSRDENSNSLVYRVETLANTSDGANSSGSKELFPERLMTILNDESVSRDIVSWLPNGRSFIITRPDIFMESVLPLYITPVQQPKDVRTASPKYPSFTRKLNRWYVHLSAWSYQTLLYLNHFTFLLIGAFVKSHVDQKQEPFIIHCSGVTCRSFASRWYANEHVPPRRQTIDPVSQRRSVEFLL
jgi:HSF-type DNA-binding